MTRAPMWYPSYAESLSASSSLSSTSPLPPPGYPSAYSSSYEPSYEHADAPPMVAEPANAWEASTATPAVAYATYAYSEGNNGMRGQGMVGYLASDKIFDGLGTVDLDALMVLP